MSGKKFRFSLQQVLDLRQREADEARVALEAAVRATREQQERLLEARSALDELGASPAPSGRVDQHRLRRQASHNADALQRLRREERRLQELKRRETRMRSAWEKCQQAVEGMQTLYEEEKAEHERRERAEEAAFLDEQAVMRHGRDPMGGT